MKKKYYKIGHTQIQLNIPNTLPIPANMEKFEVWNETGCSTGEENMISSADGKRQVQMHYDISLTEDLTGLVDMFCEGRDVKRIEREALTVLYLDGKECRLIRTPDSAEPYAVSLEEEESRTKVWIRESAQHLFVYETFFISLLSLEKLMMKNGAFILHSAYMCRDGKAILFSAPSETGKSTQAALWEKYRGTRNINGDRSLLIREEDGWYAYGWPVCGSSEICHNEAYPIEAIVMLYQAKENVITRLFGMAIVRRIMSQITINMWNREFQEKAWEMMDELIREVPVFELGCDISEGAVECLERALEER